MQKDIFNVLEHSQKCSMKVPRLDLLEIMCSDESELTKQAAAMGYRAKRFGWSEGDLQTKAGRRKLFQILALQNPDYVWYSPVCGAWSKWSNLNTGKSLQDFQDVTCKRRDHLWQISLAVVLYRYQNQQSKHFQMEQLDGSLMLQQPALSEIVTGTQSCRFDMCRLGDLKDPESGLALRSVSVSKQPRKLCFL